MSYNSVYLRSENGGILFPVRSIIGDVACVANSLSEAQLAALLSDLPCKVKTIKRPKAGVLTIDLSSASQARQLGYACAQAKTENWSVAKVEEGVYQLFNVNTAESFRVSDGPVITGKAYEVKDGETRAIEISFRRPSVKRQVGDHWIEQAITLNVHKATNTNRLAKLTPWTWYHILARYLCEEKVSAIDGEFRGEVEWGYRLEMFKLANGNPKAIRRLSTVVVNDGRYEFEAFYQGAPNNIPVFVDERFVSVDDFKAAAARAIVTA